MYNAQKYNYLFLCRDASGAAQRGSFKSSFRSKTAGGAGEPCSKDTKRVRKLLPFAKHTQIYIIEDYIRTSVNECLTNYL